MRDVQVRQRVEERVVVHRDQRATVIRESLLVPPAPGAPPLAVERTVSPAGPSRPPVVLLHGFGQNRFSWRVSDRSLCAWLADRGHEVLNLELRGHGRSRDVGAHAADDLHDYVVDTLRVVGRCAAPPFLIGHSLGGAVGIGAATEAPVAGLIHLAGVYSFATDSPALRALARATLAVEPALRAAPIRVKTRVLGRLLGKLYGVAGVATAPLAGWVPGSMEPALLEERLRDGFDWTSAAVWLQMCHWALGEPLRYASDFERLDRPLLVIAGDHDRLASPRDAQRCFDASGSTDKELLLLNRREHGTHWGHLDVILGAHAPEQVWTRMGAWLAARC